MRGLEGKLYVHVFFSLLPALYSYLYSFVSKKGIVSIVKMQKDQVFSRNQQMYW